MSAEVDAGLGVLRTYREFVGRTRSRPAAVTLVRRETSQGRWEVTTVGCAGTSSGGERPNNVEAGRAPGRPESHM